MQIAVRFFVVISVLAINVNLFSQWSTNPAINNPVANTNSMGQDGPAIAPDGYGGMFVSWQDSSFGGGLVAENIYVNRVSSDGNLLWGVGGVPICTAPREQSFSHIIADGTGGCIIVWQDRRNNVDFNIYAQKVDSSGAILWPANGVLICSAAHDQLYPIITTDNNGGAILSWQDFRNGVDRDIYAQRINASGTVLWALNGVSVCDAPMEQYQHSMVSDLLGGAIITWNDYRDSTIYGDIYAQRIDLLGNMVWNFNGIGICDTIFWQYNPAMTADGFGGAIIAWEDNRDNTINNIYVQRVNGAGIIQWQSNGVPITSTTTSGVGVPCPIADQTGGAIIGFELDNAGPAYTDIYAKRINGNGIATGPVNGVPICTLNNYQTNPQLLFDGNMSAYITWTDKRSGSNLDIYAQKIDTNGVVQFAANGIPISIAAVDQSGPVVCTDNSGGALVAWTDQRNCCVWHNNTFAQRISPSGSLCGVLPTVTILSSPGTVICDSATITFTANITHGGASPSYQWQINGANVGTNSNTYIDSLLNDGDIVTCILTSADPCATPLIVTSAPDTITVYSTAAPTINISASPSGVACAGLPINFTASITSGGSSPTYQWQVNGTNVGTNSSSYVDSTLSNGDSIQCILTSSNICASIATVNSNLIVVSINPNTDVQGHVTYTGGDLVDGTAVLYNYNPFYASFDTIQVQPLDATGHYQMINVPVGNYLLKIYPDTITYPDLTSTYYFDQWVWDSATVVNHGCIINDTLDVVMIELNLGGGSGLLHGQIIEGYGWGRNLGDPIGNLEVKVYSISGSEVKGNSFTDLNGYFTFDSIPFGNYLIIVDIPGLERTLIHNITVDAINYEYLCLDYVVDSVSIYYPQPCNSNASIIENGSSDGSLIFYPNPANDFINILSTIELKDARLELINSIGQLVRSSQKINLLPGDNYYLDLSSLESGLYTVRLNNYSGRIIKK